MVETMRMEGHTALVHTAAASNLGQMLQRICLADGVPLVNIVRRPEQAELLRGLGATHVCDSSAPTFMDDLTEALVDTGATIAFDAIGGGRQAGQILACMEAAINASATEYSRYGSNVHKQVYIYGGLDRGPTEFNRNFGMAWGIGGWLLTPFLGRLGAGGHRAPARPGGRPSSPPRSPVTTPTRSRWPVRSASTPSRPTPGRPPARSSSSARRCRSRQKSRISATSARWWMSSDWSTERSR